MEKKKLRYVEYMCSYCGRKQTKGINSGRPQPTHCLKRAGNQPHRWVINRKY